MTTTPQEPAPQEDPQTQVDNPPDHVPSSEDTVADDPGTDADAGGAREPLDDAVADREGSQPGVDPDWSQEAR